MVKPDETQINKLFNEWVNINLDRIDISDFNDNEGDAEEERECDEGTVNLDFEEGSRNNFSFKKKGNENIRKGSVINWLNDAKIKRDVKLAKLTKSLDAKFPGLKGDEVTFIGTTFIRYGEEEPYLNHCIVKDTCNKLPQVKNSLIESYRTEKDVLLAWSKLIRNEDPDIIIGYNIFGFDYSFMYDRAVALNAKISLWKCHATRASLVKAKNGRWQTNARSRREFHIYCQWTADKYEMPDATNRFITFRREYQLTKYKLDYVSGYFIGDKVSKIEHMDDKTKIYSNNLTGLENNTFVSFEEEAHSVDQYKNGAKFEVFDIDADEGTFYIHGHETPDMTKKVRWGLAKDDVTPQDIFRMTNEGPKERSLIAKYCIQDCNLVHHLLNKIDVITGFVEMASLCSVPLDFLVMRGQGIKLTSYIAKKCREKNTLMPVIDKSTDNGGYEGAIVLDPKCDLYLNDPVACVDYSSLYPSSMITRIFHTTVKSGLKNMTC